MLPYMLSVVMVFPFIHSRPIRLELKLFYQTYTARKPPSACTVVTLSPPDATEWFRLLLVDVICSVGRTRPLTMHCQWAGKPSLVILTFDF